MRRSNKKYHLRSSIHSNEMKRRGSNRKLEEHRLINYSVMLGSWKNGSKRELKIGKRIRQLRKRGREETLNLSINKHKN
jgi:hypothetical protein